MENIKEEICLVANIIDRLLETNGRLRADELEPLTKRLRVAAVELSRIDYQSHSGPALSPFSRNADGVEGIGGGSRQGTSKLHLSKSPTPSGATRKQIRRSQIPSAACSKVGNSKVLISSEVSQSICCTLYNLLEGATRLLRASHGHIFVKRGDDMFSIANVSRKLAIPPPQVHHRCVGSADAEVLGSSIALNRHVDEVGRKSAVLIFPIHTPLREGGAGETIATIHVERREHVFAPFSESDECILYLTSLFCGELMSRIPQINFLETFYDPSTQLIIAPFEPYRPVVLPPVESRVVSTLGGTGKQFSETPEYAARAISQMKRKIGMCGPEILIRRERHPTSSTKPLAPGVAHMPSLLEIKAYVENLQSCWKKNMLDNVDLLELDRGTQMDLKIARKELAVTRCKLAAATDKLRLYELDASDYKREYGAMKSELDAYMDNLERLQ
ncbi:hypothetical protein, conserved [Leishmania tarentolae]|uniref:Uncharacterized protein n=1 Tax=Leishmania tarentolae TaxID=5689 RepID=A0A640KVG9_LEITA|nr:hypothetical protein, conserved [Leishmania tarentolae]